MKHVFLALLLLFPLAAQATDTPDPFPLATGTTWIYDANVKWEADGKEQRKSRSWTMEISSVVLRENVVIARGSGLPSDLTFYEDGVKPAPFLMVKVGPWKVYIVRGKEKVDEVWKKATAGESLSESVTEADLLLDFPLIEGKTYGETSQILSGTPLYVYGIEGKSPFVASSAKGLNVSGPLDEIPVTFPTNADSTTWKFTNRIGFTGFFYSHHGSTSEVDCRLNEFRPGK